MIFKASHEHMKSSRGENGRNLAKLRLIFYDVDLYKFS